MSSPLLVQEISFLRLWRRREARPREEAERRLLLLSLLLLLLLPPLLLWSLLVLQVAPFLLAVSIPPVPMLPRHHSLAYSCPHRLPSPPRWS